MQPRPNVTTALLLLIANVALAVLLAALPSRALATEEVPTYTCRCGTNGTFCCMDCGSDGIPCHVNSQCSGIPCF
jgi:hypothetical protein